MTVDVRDRVGVLLSGVGGRGSFSATQTAVTDDLHLQVRGLGSVEFPVSDEQAQKLCELGQSARYGKGEQTLVDPTVRNTWEIPPSRVKIDKRRWEKTLAPVLERLRADLGLPDGCTLEAELHSMLVYAPGQFFVRHQDSEKSDAMVGSLVVTLPSPRLSRAAPSRSSTGARSRGSGGRRRSCRSSPSTATVATRSSR